MKEYADAVAKAVAETEHGCRDHDAATERLCDALKQHSGGKVVFIGNGGSMSACTHMANDLCLAFGTAIALDSVANMSCIGNDMGYSNVFSSQLKWFFNPGDTLVALSCSGKSPNILNAVDYVRTASRAKHIITFSGFDSNNPLRGGGDLNFWVPSTSYGVVQIAHEIILHSAIDRIAGLKL